MYSDPDQEEQMSEHYRNADDVLFLKKFAKHEQLH